MIQKLERIKNMKILGSDNPDVLVQINQFTGEKSVIRDPKLIKKILPTF